MRIEDIDKNFKLETEIKREGLRFVNVVEEPFTVHGLIRISDRWVRMPLDIAEKTSPAVYNLAKRTAGGRVRFVTDSPYVAIKTVQPPAGVMPHMPLTGHAGFDLYIGEGKNSAYCRSFVPPATLQTGNGYESVLDLTPQQLGDGGLHSFTINFPLYHDVYELYVGLKEGSVIQKAPDYTVKTPMVYYGSSITQGGCASRPGTCYQGWLSRWFDADYINLGFSGSAKGEDEIADYVASLSMSAFIYDYDYNSPTYETLVDTHEKMLRKVREAHPEVPIICASRPRFPLNPEETARRDLIAANVEKLKAEGDRLISFIPGKELLAFGGTEGTVDYCHPTDLGFYSMALRFAEELEKYGFER
ncbi:MAG: hypothetical protein IJY39_09940 [Clostridia bacterium]|nr:hypothetical protein [Clostridia bacterium]